MTKPQNTMKPFDAGDVFLACTYLNDPDDDHAGLGRILQFDKNLNEKGVLWTEGGHHLIAGLAFDRKGVLWAFNDHCVIHVDPASGRQRPLQHFASRTFRSASFTSEGHVYLGEHLNGDSIHVSLQTKLPTLPGTDWFGDGNLYKFDSRGELVKVFKTETTPEMTGFKGVTHHTLHPSEQYVTYCTETGKRVMRYNVVDDYQMPDLMTYPGDDLRDRNWAIAPKYLPDGRLLLIRGATIDVLNQEGKVIHTYDLKDYGWAEITPCSDRKHFLTANIFTGVAAKVDMDSGNIVGSIDTGYKAPRRSLAGIAEFPG